jgi:ADP-ribose pyrophosphatase YjhB (NUDIX family)
VEQRGQVAKAMAVIRRPTDGALLVSEHADPEGRLFHRPLGGHVEFGEYSIDALHREFAEEIHQQLARVRLLGVLENIFEWSGAVQHEIVFVYLANFADVTAYDIPEQAIADETDDTVRVIWRRADAISPPLYPEGVGELVALTSDPDARQRGSV